MKDILSLFKLFPLSETQDKVLKKRTTYYFDVKVYKSGQLIYKPDFSIKSNKSLTVSLTKNNSRLSIKLEGREDSNENDVFNITYSLVCYGEDYRGDFAFNPNDREVFLVKKEDVQLEFSAHT